MNAIHQHWRRTVLLILTLLFILVLIIGDGGRGNVLALESDDVDDNGDLLAYTVTNSAGERSLMLYEPDTGIHTTLLSDIGYSGFRFSADGRIALSLTSKGYGEIHILDTQSENRLPVNLSQEKNIFGRPLAWSPNGRYLAISSYPFSDGRQIYVWDGETAINITPNGMVKPARGYDIAWSPDGRLAITAWFDFLDDFKDSEIYVWDGETPTNLSQNPTGVDRNPSWSADGKLAFLSARDGEYDILIWDGISVKDSVPDINTFSNVMPEFTAAYSSPTWTNEGLLAFLAIPFQEEHRQVFVWDGQTATNISQNPGSPNQYQRWRADGHWAFQTFASSQGILHIRDAENRTILTTAGSFQPVWSSEGNLIYCNGNRVRYILSMWDGQDIIDIAQGYPIFAQWQSGPSVLCARG